MPVDEAMLSRSPDARLVLAHGYRSPERPHGVTGTKRSHDAQRMASFQSLSLIAVGEMNHCSLNLPYN
jgi:hypothetical protein